MPTTAPMLRATVPLGYAAEQPFLVSRSAWLGNLIAWRGMRIQPSTKEVIYAAGGWGGKVPMYPIEQV